MVVTLYVQAYVQIEAGKRRRYVARLRLVREEDMWLKSRMCKYESRA
jgi:hypothetical protein